MAGLGWRDFNDVEIVAFFSKVEVLSTRFCSWNLTSLSFFVVGMVNFLPVINVYDNGVV